MTSILLQDYVNPRKRYTLDSETGAVAEALFKDAGDAGKNTAGYGGYRTIGLLRNKRRLFVAAYTDEKTWLVQVGDKVFDWADRDLCARREAKAFFVKQFTISRGDEILLSLPYFYMDYQVWPDNGDICTFIERTAQTPDAHEKFIYLWRAKKQGRDIASKEFIEEFERFRRAGSPGAH